MTENYFEYAVDQKPNGKNLVYRILLIMSYIVFALAYFLFFYTVKIPQVIALLPFFLLFLVICGHPNGYEVVSHFGFDLNLLYDQRH